MAFNDLQLKVAASAAVQSAHANLAKLSLFSRSYSELADRAGASVVVPVYDLSGATEFVAGTNDYATGASNEIGGAVVSLNQHYVKSAYITDKQLAETGINWAKDTATALADSVTRSAVKYVLGLINSATVSLSSDTELTSKNLVAGLYAIAENADIPVDRAVIVLGPTDYVKVLSQLDVGVYGNGDAVQRGVVPQLFGFKGLVCSSGLADGVRGFIAADSSLALASRYLEPMTPDAYPQTWKAVDEDGFTLGFRRFMDLGKGYDIMACNCLFGATVVQPNKIVRLV